MVGAGTMAARPQPALTIVAGSLYPDLPLRPRLVAVADVNDRLATGLAGRVRLRARRAGLAARSIEPPDVDLVVACLPPVLNREVVLAAAAAGKHVVCEKPLGDIGRGRRRDARGVPGGRRLPRPRGRAIAGRRRVRAIRGHARPRGARRRSAACGPRSCSTTRPTRTSRCCGGSGGRWPVAGSPSTPATTSSTAPASSSARSRRSRRSTTTFIAERPLPGADAIGNRGGARAVGGPRRVRAGRRRGCRRRARDVRRRGLRRARDEPRGDRRGACRCSSRSSDRRVGRVGPRAARRVPGLPARRPVRRSATAGSS